MAFALVGAAGAVTQGASGAAITPAWGVGANRTVGNLLVLVVNGSTGTRPAAPAGWSTGPQSPAGSAPTASIFYKTAAGADAAPTVALVASTVLTGQLYEFSGYGGALDKSGSVRGTNTSPVATASAADVAPGELVIFALNGFYSTAAATTSSVTLNNGATATSTKNDATSTSNHYNFGYGITTSNAAADSATGSLTTTHLTDDALAIASFTLPPEVSPTADATTSAALNVSAQTLLDPLTAGATTSATMQVGVTTNLTAQLATSASTPGAIELAAVLPAPTSAPQAFAATAASTTSASAVITAPAVLTPTAAMTTSATTLVTATAFLSVVAQMATTAAALVTAATHISPAAAATTSATTTVATKVLLALSAQLVTSATATVIVGGVLLTPTAAATSIAGIAVTAQTHFSPTAQAATSAGMVVSVAQRLVVAAAMATAANNVVHVPAPFTANAVTAFAASNAVGLPAPLSPHAAMMTNATCFCGIPRVGKKHTGAGYWAPLSMTSQLGNRDSVLGAMILTDHSRRFVIGGLRTGHTTRGRLSAGPWGALFPLTGQLATNDSMLRMMLLAAVWTRPEFATRRGIVETVTRRTAKEV